MTISRLNRRILTLQLRTNVLLKRRQLSDSFIHLNSRHRSPETGRPYLHDVASLYLVGHVCFPVRDIETNQTVSFTSLP